jgi:hypothetical protein
VTWLWLSAWACITSVYGSIPGLLMINRDKFYCRHIAELFSELESRLKLIPLIHHKDHFVPTHTTIATQMRHWPPELFPYPPAAWVEPQRGCVEVQGRNWDFAFHGSGLTFIQQDTTCDVSIEFGRQGDVLLTAWTIRLYLECVTLETDPIRQEQVRQQLLARAVAERYLEPLTLLYDKEPGFQPGPRLGIQFHTSSQPPSE